MYLIVSHWVCLISYSVARSLGWSVWYVATSSILPAVMTDSGGVVGMDGRETGGGWGKEVLCDSTTLAWCTLNKRN